MRTRYPGRCYECGRWVEVGFGHFERHAGGWRVKCVRCASGRELGPRGDLCAQRTRMAMGLPMVPGGEGVAE